LLLQGCHLFAPTAERSALPATQTAVVLAALILSLCAHRCV
jgi:hypothetical protein